MGVRSGIKGIRGQLGPGLLVAATGVGAGDLIAAAVAGQRYGVAVLWAVLVGAGCKWVLNEGIARWQLATGQSLIAGWAQRLPRVVFWIFGGYLVGWSFMVAGAVGSACGVAAKALWPDAPLSVAGWTILQAVSGFALVRWGRYAVFEKVMQGLIVVMFGVVIIGGAALMPQASLVWRGLIVPQVPPGGLWFVLGLMGGVGGSVTLLCYGYWIQQKQWTEKSSHVRVRWDLGIAYGLTAVFGLAMIIIAAGASPEDGSGTALVLSLSERLGELFGPTGKQVFLIGFWCAVFSSLLGVWQGVPHLFADWWQQRRRDGAERESSTHATAPYRWYLGFLTLPPLVLQQFDKPLLIVVIYAVVGAFFMPFLAATLLVMNNRREWVGELKNSAPINVGLSVSLVIFGVLFAVKLTKWL